MDAISSLKAKNENLEARLDEASRSATRWAMEYDGQKADAARLEGAIAAALDELKVPNPQTVGNAVEILKGQLREEA